MTQIFCAKTILPIYREPLSQAALVVENGTIVALGPRDEIIARYPKVEPLDYGNQVILPGLVNAHAQMEMVGSEISWDGNQYVNSLLGLIEKKRSLSPEDRKKALRFGFEKAFASGTTCVGDVGHYFELADVFCPPPLRLMTSSELLLSSESDISKNFQNSLTFVDDVQTVANERRFAGLAPYAPYMLSRHLLKVLAQHAEENQIPLKIRAAESFAEMQFFHDASGEMMDLLFDKVGWANQKPPLHRKTPIEFLEAIGFLERAPALIGCVHLSETDLRMIYASGSTVVHCPRSNKALKLGDAPLRKILDSGIPVGLGTDLTIEDTSLSLWDEMRATAQMHRNVTAREILRMATLGAAKALKMDRLIGSLEAGKKADFLVVSLQKRDEEDLETALLRSTEDRHIKAMYMDGMPV